MFEYEGCHSLGKPERVMAPTARPYENGISVWSTRETEAYNRGPRCTVFLKGYIPTGSPEAARYPTQRRRARGNTCSNLHR